MTPHEAPQARALELLAEGGIASVLEEPWALAALGDPGQWAGDVERALRSLPARDQAAIRRAARSVLRAGRAEGAVISFPGSVPSAVPAPVVPLLLSARGGCWIRDAGRYVSVDPTIAVHELRRLGHDLSVPTGTCARVASYAEAYARVGARVESVVYELGAAQDRYDSGTLYLAAGQPDPDATPREDLEIADWLSTLCGHDRRHTRLLDWLAAAWDLRHPTCALYLQGGGGTGKSMLATALQRCWGRRTASYADVVLGSYSGAIVRQPIVWLDERAPEDHGGRGTAAFRSLVGNRSHVYAEKYQPSATILGCPRLIVTSNTDDALRFGREDLARDDLEAIAVRVLHLEIDSRAARLLSDTDTSDWVETEDHRPGRLCRHLAWLRDHHEIATPGRRLLVEGEVGAWLRRQSTQSGLAQDVLVALVRALTDLRDAEDPITRERLAAHLLQPEPGHVLVSATDLHRAWPLLTGDRSGRITVARLGRVLRGLSGHGPRSRERRHAVANDLLQDACTLLHGSADLLLDRIVP